MTYWKLERPSKRSGKKWKVRVPTSSGRGKTVAFGDATMSDYTIHKDKARRERYRTRHQNDRIDDPYAPGFWSWWSLWGESSDLAKAHADAVKRAKKILGVKKDPEGNEVARKNPSKAPLMGEAAQVIATYNVPPHLHAEFLRGLAVEWEKAPTTDLHTLGRVVLDHLGENAHHYRRARRARTRVSPRVQACFDALLSNVQEQYPSLSCTIEVDETAGERDGKACSRAFAFCEDHGEGGAFRIAIAGKLNDPDIADDSRVDGILRHELAHAVLLHGGDIEHTERDADEVAEALFGSPIFYDEDDVQTTDPSAPGAHRPRPEYLDDENGRTRDAPTLDTPKANPYHTGTMHQLHTVEDVASFLDDCAAQGDAKAPRMLASQFSQQAKEAAGAKARMLLALAKAARHCAGAIEARLAGEVDRAMVGERMCESALADAQGGPESLGRGNPSEDVYELIMDGLVPTTPAEKARLRRGARKYDLDVYHVGGGEWAFTGSMDNLRKYLSSQVTKAEEVERLLGFARGVRGNPEGRGNPSEDVYELIMDGLVPTTPAEKARLRRGARKYDLDVYHVGGGEWAFTGSMDNLRKYLSSQVTKAEEVERLLGFARGVRGNPEWAKKLGSGLYKGARYSAETARDLYVGAREAHAAHGAEAPAERKNPRRAGVTPAAVFSRRLPEIGMLTVRPDPDGGYARATIEVTKAFADEWDYDMLNQAHLSRMVDDAVAPFRSRANFYAVALKYRGREFSKLYPRGAGV